jgi:nucleotide-binding universal stress UspA family protein
VFKQIVIGYDASAQADDALALGKLIARAGGASLTAVAVIQFDPIWAGRGIRGQPVDAELEQRLEQAAESAGARAEQIQSSSPARGLHDFAEEHGADLVVLGSAEYGKVGQILAGSVAMSLLHGSPCAVAIAPLGYATRVDAGIEEVAVGYDGQPESGAALDDAIELARAASSRLKIVTVVEPPAIGYGKLGGPDPGWREMKEIATSVMQEHLDEAVDRVPDDVRAVPELVEGQAAETLARIAVADAGVLVVGSRGYGPLRRLLLGSVSTKLVRMAPCPLIVHPRPATSGDGA